MTETVGSVISLTIARMTVNMNLQSHAQVPVGKQFVLVAMIGKYVSHNSYLLTHNLEQVMIQVVLQSTIVWMESPKANLGRGSR